MLVRSTRRGLIAALFVAAPLCVVFSAACAGGGAADASGAGDDDDDDDGSTATPTPTPPEGDDDVFTVAPGSAAALVYVANPENDNVIRIDTITRDIDVIAVGRKPVDLRVSPDGARVVTFNSLSHDVSIIDAGTMVETRLPVRPVTNMLISSPLSTHGVAIWTAARDATGQVEGSQNPGEVSIVDYVAQTVVSSVMGFKPRGVGFTADDTRAFVLSDGLLAAIDLTNPAKPKTLIPLAADPTTAPPAKEIAIAPDGTSALVLSETGGNALTLVDLATGALTPVGVGTAGTIATDLDLSSDGRFYLVASAGAVSSTIDLLDRDNAFAKTTVTIPGAAGSVEVSPDDEEIWVFSKNALDERIWRVDLEADAGGPNPVVTEYALVKPVRAVFVAPNGSGIVILHRFTDVNDGVPSGESDYADDDVMSVLDPDAGGGVPLLSSVALDDEPDQVAVTSDGQWAFAQLPDAQIALVASLTTLLVDPLPVGSKPLFIGAVQSGHTGYVLQKHPLGRISFIEPDTLDIDTVTGFEINAEIDP